MPGIGWIIANYLLRCSLSISFCLLGQRDKKSHTERLKIVLLYFGHRPIYKPPNSWTHKLNYTHRPTKKPDKQQNRQAKQNKTADKTVTPR